MHFLHIGRLQKQLSAADQGVLTSASTAKTPASARYHCRPFTPGPVARSDSPFCRRDLGACTSFSKCVRTGARRWFLTAGCSGAPCRRVRERGPGATAPDAWREIDLLISVGHNLGPPKNSSPPTPRPCLVSALLSRRGEAPRGHLVRLQAAYPPCRNDDCARAPVARCLQARLRASSLRGGAMRVGAAPDCDGKSAAVIAANSYRVEQASRKRRRRVIGSTRATAHSPPRELVASRCAGNEWEVPNCCARCCLRHDRDEIPRSLTADAHLID